jgi:hypothetical protein
MLEGQGFGLKLGSAELEATERAISWGLRWGCPLSTTAYPGRPGGHQNSPYGADGRYRG